MSEKKPDEKLVRAINPFGLRMLPELKEQLESAARANGRSMNSEIVARLERSLALDEQQESDREKLRRGEPIIPPSATSLSEYGLPDDAVMHLDPEAAEEHLALVRAQYERAIILKATAKMAAKRGNSQ